MNVRLRKGNVSGWRNASWAVKRPVFQLGRDKKREELSRPLRWWAQFQEENASRPLVLGAAECVETFWDRMFDEDWVRRRKKNGRVLVRPGKKSSLPTFELGSCWEDMFLRYWGMQTVWSDKAEKKRAINERINELSEKYKEENGLKDVGHLGTWFFDETADFGIDCSPIPTRGAGRISESGLYADKRARFYFPRGWVYKDRLWQPASSKEKGVERASGKSTREESRARHYAACFETGKSMGPYTGPKINEWSDLVAAWQILVAEKVKRNAKAKQDDTGGAGDSAESCIDSGPNGSGAPPEFDPSAA